MTNAPIYNDRYIGDTTVATHTLVAALLGKGLTDTAKFGSMSLAAKILSEHPNVIAHPGFEPETVVRAIRDAAWIRENAARKAAPISPEENDQILGKSDRAFALCAEMARIIIGPFA